MWIDKNGKAHKVTDAMREFMADYADEQGDDADPLDMAAATAGEFGCWECAAGPQDIPNELVAVAQSMVG